MPLAHSRITSACVAPNVIGYQILSPLATDQQSNNNNKEAKKYKKAVHKDSWRKKPAIKEVAQSPLLFGLWVSVGTGIHRPESNPERYKKTRISICK